MYSVLIVVWCGVQVYLEHVVDALEAVDSLEGLLCGGSQGKGTAAEGVGLTRAAVDFNHLHFLVSHTGDHTLVRGLSPVRGREGGKRGERGRRGEGEGGREVWGSGWCTVRLWIAGTCCEQCVYVPTLKRIQRVTLALQGLLEDAFTSGLRAQDRHALYECLQTYAVVSRQASAEDMYRMEVRRYMEKVWKQIWFCSKFPF